MRTATGWCTSVRDLIQLHHEAPPDHPDRPSIVQALTEALRALPPEVGGVSFRYWDLGSSDRVFADYTYSLAAGRIVVTRTVPGDVLLLPQTCDNRMSSHARENLLALLADYVPQEATRNRLQALADKLAAQLDCRCDSASLCPPCADDASANAQAIAFDPHTLNVVDADQIPDAEWARALFEDAAEEVFPELSQKEA